jgi:hypothetical protein
MAAVGPSSSPRRRVQPPAMGTARFCTAVGVGGLIIAGAFPFLLLPLASLRRAAGEGEGSLIALGAGTKPIDEDALGSLRRARVFQSNLALQWTLFGLLSLLAFSGVLIDPNIFAQWYARAPVAPWYGMASRWAHTRSPACRLACGTASFRASQSASRTCRSHWHMTLHNSPRWRTN